jgi:integrase
VSAFPRERGITLHALRHSHASHTLASNIHPKIVQERLGHSSIAITMDIYSQLMPNMQAKQPLRLTACYGRLLTSVPTTLGS